jgi:hypothetical protein
MALAANAPGKTAVDRTIQLFNGKDLTNFYTWLVDLHYEDPDKDFTAVDAIDPAGSHLRRRHDYSDHQLASNASTSIPIRICAWDLRLAIRHKGGRLPFESVHSSARRS